MLPSGRRLCSPGEICRFAFLCSVIVLGVCLLFMADNLDSYSIRVKKNAIQTGKSVSVSD